MDFKVNKIIIETERLILRAYQEDDLNDFYEYCQVEGVGEAAGWLHHKDINESQRILNIFLKQDTTFAIVYKENKKVIGSIGIKDTQEIKPEFKSYLASEIGYVLSKDYWGKGLMSEAIKTVINYLFENTQLQILYCGHFIGNNKSKRVIEKAGFTFFTDGTFQSSQLNKTFAEKFYYLLNPLLPLQ
ncbi:MAG: GNAT family N-acetyltransferase [Bacillales bacterium]|jgi:ribosomal-protein-alanine N-acetyltransferase|nr:GNAT family N-acetyltransferase [Bacillales bacterium]